MGRHVLPWIVLLPFAAGCAGPGGQTRSAEWEPAVSELQRANSRLEQRLDEVTRNILSLRERVDAQESALASLQTARQEPEPRAPLRVVRLEPPPPVTDGPAADGPRAATPAADLYRRAFNAFREGRYGQAILDFEDFLRRSPEHEYAGNAQYWIGESYFSQGEYEQSVLEFHKVIERYPQQAKAPDALLKIGLAFRELGEVERGTVFLERVAAEYPQSEAALQAQRVLRGER
ncbi:MAG: tol-pal system protein YbgF [Thermodesulfobacteriota bacterium]